MVGDIYINSNSGGGFQWHHDRTDRYDPHPDFTSLHPHLAFYLLPFHEFVPDIF